MRETRILEFKETITNTFLKTVSAFSNYNGGMILFGVDDDGNVKGLPDVKQACLDIENKINDSIEGLPPAISIDQKSTNRNPRSTVGTVTEIYDYFRLLYARIGIPHCPKCGKVISRQFCRCRKNYKGKQ